MSDLKWLPPKANINDFESVNDLIRFLYTIFEKDFKDDKNPIKFNNQNVRIAHLQLHVRCEKLVGKNQNCNNTDYNCNNCVYVDKEDIFNHITCHELSKKDRTPGIFELERAIRVPWIRTIIENCNNNHPSIKYYETVVDGHLRKCFWLDAEKYLVILTEDHNNDLFLTSAYYLYNRKKSDRARKEYKIYINNLKKNAK